MNGKITIDGREYILGAVHAGVACYISKTSVASMEQRCGFCPGDYAHDEIQRYLVNPNEYPGAGKRTLYLVMVDADNPERLWPHMNEHVHPLAEAPKREAAPVVSDWKASDFVLFRGYDGHDRLWSNALEREFFMGHDGKRHQAACGAEHIARLVPLSIATSDAKSWLLARGFDAIPILMEATAKKAAEGAGRSAGGAKFRG